jgi:hypothetical protein
MDSSSSWSTVDSHREMLARSPEFILVGDSGHGSSTREHLEEGECGDPIGGLTMGGKVAMGLAAMKGGDGNTSFDE